MSGDHPSSEESPEHWPPKDSSNDPYAADVEAIRASYQDYKNGERGTIAGEHSAQLRDEFGPK